MMKRISRLYFATALLSLFCVKDVAAGGKYGFSSNMGGMGVCDMWSLPIPVTFQSPKFNGSVGESILTIGYNVLWVSNHGNGMGYYYDFFKNKFGEDYYWPKEYAKEADSYADINIGNATPYCTEETECTKDGDKATVGAGLSKYKDLVNEFGEGKVKVVRGTIELSDALIPQMLDGRSFKVLRIEVFTLPGYYTKKGNYEPFYLEYRSKTGSNEMTLVDIGGYTFNLSNKNNISGLQNPVNLNKVSDIQVWFSLINTDSTEMWFKPTENIYANAQTNLVDDSILQSSPIPDTCQ